MVVAALFFAGKDWLWPAVIGALVAIAIVAISYVRTPAPRGLRLTCAALKIAGFAALAFFLLDPMWTSERAKPGANVIAVIADNSASMDLHGNGESESRAEVLRRSVTGEKNLWLRELGENFEVRNYLCDTRLSPVEDFTALNFKGRGSAFGAALAQVRDRHRNQPLAGIILLTDGLIPDLSAAELAALPPVYPVQYGSQPPERDLAISNTTVTQSSFEDAPVTIQAEITALGFAGRKVVGELIPVTTKGEAKPKPLLEEELTVPMDSDKLVFRFQVRPEKTGVVFYRLRVRSKGAVDEATPENNETLVTVDRGTGPYRVLYVSGRPNWEYKFLRRALETDTEIQLVGLIRIAKREPKFEFRSRAGESSNPLFRGFGNQAPEETEQYDQPVLMRLNTRDQVELQEGFPTSPKDLFGYRAIIIDDLEAAFFTADQKVLVQRFVSERGGGFLMLGGAESFAEGKYDRTPIGDLLPVYLSAAPAREAADDATYRLKLTREGWLQPWARLRRTEPDENARLEALPGFDILEHARGLKPAAMVVAAVSDGTRDVPALATQRFGRGRASALLVGDFWQSGLGDEARQLDLGKAWRQLVRWLITDVPDPVEVRAEPEPGTEAMSLQVRVRDDEFRPLDNARVSISVLTEQSPEPIVLTAEASSEEAGLFEAQFFPRESGGYRVEAEATNEAGAVVGKAATGWATNFAAAEFGTLTPNRSMLETLAKQTGGEVLSPEGLEALARRLPSERAPVTEVVTQPLWHTPAFFVFALGCFVGEWALRRWKGLA
ncbi:MAG: hypothetical protein ABI680_06385 [Chthoniobacteraceae bacterium]